LKFFHFNHSKCNKKNDSGTTLFVGLGFRNKETFSMLSRERPDDMLEEAMKLFPRKSFLAVEVCAVDE